MRIAGPQKVGRMAERRENPLEGGQRSLKGSRGPLEDIRGLPKTTGSARKWQVPHEGSRGRWMVAGRAGGEQRPLEDEMIRWKMT